MSPSNTVDLAMAASCVEGMTGGGFFGTSGRLSVQVSLGDTEEVFTHMK